MKHFIGEGNLLLKRTEKKFNVKETDVQKIIKKIIATKAYKIEMFFRKYPITIVSNTIYAGIECRDMKKFKVKSYDGARIRQYHSPDWEMESYFFGEFKTKKDSKVVKTRRSLMTDEVIQAFSRDVEKCNFVTVVHLTYRRCAVNSKNGRVRITFDTKPIYLDTNFKDISCEAGVVPGVAKVKVKFVGRAPKGVIKLVEKWAI